MGKLKSFVKKILKLLFAAPLKKVLKKIDENNKRFDCEIERQTLTIQELRIWNSDLINEIKELRIWNSDRINEIQELRVWNSDRINEIHWLNGQISILRTELQNLNSDISKIICPEFEKEILRKLREKVSDGQKIRVGFFVVWASQFTTKRIYRLMQNDPLFEPIVIVNKIPADHDAARFAGVYEKTIEDLKSEGFEFVSNFDGENYADVSEKIDIGIFHTLHSPYYNRLSSPQYLFSKKVLLYYANYGFNVSSSTEREIQEASNRYYLINYIYKDYSDNHFIPKTAKKNICLGYPKLDELATKISEKREKPLVILAPHHDITHNCFMGNFFNTKEIYTELPKHFPQVDFAFRPHPLWLSNLRIEWGKEKADAYLEKVLENKNVYYSTEADYYQLWANSSAMLHDCGSFLTEYLFAKKPVMFLQDDMELNKKGLNVCGQKCVEHCYLGHTLDEAIKFVQEVVIEKKDVMKVSREKFLSEELQMNYPRASEAIFADIKKDLGIRDEATK